MLPIAITNKPGASQIGRKTEKEEKQAKHKSNLKQTKLEVTKMTPSESARVKECVREIAEILYRNTAPEKSQTLESIEETVREHLLETVGPEMAFFFVEQKTQTRQGKERIMNSCVGKLRLRRKQLERLGVEARGRISPLLQRCCLCLSANESFARAEADLELLTGMKVGHSTLQRQVQTQTD